MFGSQSQRVKFLEIGGLKIRGPNSHITYAAAKAHRDAAVTAKPATKGRINENELSSYIRMFVN